MFFLVVFSIWALFLTHIAWRTQELLGLRGYRRVLFCLMWLLVGFSYVPARIFIPDAGNEHLARGLLLSTQWIIGFAAALWTLVVFFDLLRLGIRLTGRRLQHLTGRTRRRLALALWTGAAVLGLVGWFSAQSTPHLTHLRLTVPGSARARLVVICDAHLGLTSSADQWHRTLTQARGLSPDAILIPGDLVDDGSPTAWSQVSELRTLFPQTPVFVTTGNHDAYSGFDGFAGLCNRLGFRLLRQQAAELVPGLTIAGIDDAHFIPNELAVDTVRPDLRGPVLLLSHRPAAAHYLHARPQTLVVAGHTHGGQTLPLIFLVASANGWFRAGYYEVGQARLYVSRGTGVWGPPMRILAPPELVLIEVEPGPVFDLEPFRP